MSLNSFDLFILFGLPICILVLCGFAWLGMEIRYGVRSRRRKPRSDRMAVGE